jgi:uncharacterized protein
MYNMGTALIGGILIGLSASLAHAKAGRIAGVSGILGAWLRGPWRLRAFETWFVAGLVLGGLLLSRSAWAQTPSFTNARPLGLVVAAGLLVGVGTRLGSGCTSGHGVCGLSRGSVRSLVATLVFMATAALVVFVTRHALAGVVP